MRRRGFEIAKGYEHKGLALPQRSTYGSAGYDFRSAETITIPSFVQKSWCIGNDLAQYYSHFIEPVKNDKQFLKVTPYPQIFDDMTKKGFKKMPVTFVHTGIKAYFPRDEVLKLYNRSSNPPKRGLYLANGVGIVDSDYYNNPSNDGEIGAEFINLSPRDYTIHKGDKIMQGLFEPYLLADNDKPVQKKRKGGIGSTGK